MLDRFMLEEDELTSLLASRQLIITENFTRTVKNLPLRTQVHVEARQLPPFSGATELLEEDLRDLMERKAAAVVLAGPEEKTAKVLAEDLASAGLPAMYAPNPDKPLKSRIIVTTGGLSSGFDFPKGDIAVLTHGRAARTKKRRLFQRLPHTFLPYALEQQG